MSSFRSLIAIAGPKNLKLEHLDVRTAFLQAELLEGTEIYMRQPKFFEERGEEQSVPAQEGLVRTETRTTMLEPKAGRHAPISRIQML